jgi:hypothetical protein
VSREPGFPGLAGRAWAIVLGDLKTAGVDAPAVSLEARGGRSTLGAIVRDTRPRRCETPVGSDAWLELLGSGGGEDLAEALR